MIEIVKTEIRKIKVRNDASILLPELLKNADYTKRWCPPFFEAGTPFYDRLRRPTFELEEAKKLVKREAQKFVSIVNMRLARENSQRNFLAQKIPFIKLTKLEFKKVGADRYGAYFSFSTKTGVPCIKRPGLTSIGLIEDTDGERGKWGIYGAFVVDVYIENLLINNTKKNQAKYPELIGKDFYMWKELRF